MTREKLWELGKLLNKKFETDALRAEAYSIVVTELGVRPDLIKEVCNANDLKNVLWKALERATSKIRAEEAYALAHEKGIVVGAQVKVFHLGMSLSGTVTKFRKDGMVQVKIKGGDSRGFAPEKIEVQKT